MDSISFLCRLSERDDGAAVTLCRIFNDFLDWVPVKGDDSLAGINAMLKKISIATAWHKERWGLDTFVLRKEVSERQDNLDNFLKDEVTIFPLR